MKFKKLMTALTGSLVLASLLVACGTQSNQDKSKSESTTAKTIKVKDADGKTVTVPSHPTKVVVFDNGALDTIQALDGSKSVVGVAKKNLPGYLNEFKSVDSVGGLKEPDLEKINALKPQLIITSARQKSFKADLEKIAPVLDLSLDPSKIWESTKTNIMTLATIYGQDSKAKKKIDTLNAHIATVKDKAEKSNLKTLTILSNEGQISAYAEGTRFAIINDTFGFKSVDTTIKPSTHGQSVSYEYVLEKNPDAIFVIDRTKAIGGDDKGVKFADNELVKQTKASKNGKIIEMDPAVWYLSGGGLKSTQLMLDDVEKALK